MIQKDSKCSRCKIFYKDFLLSFICQNAEIALLRPIGCICIWNHKTVEQPARRRRGGHTLKQRLFRVVGRDPLYWRVLLSTASRRSVGR